MNNQLIKAAEEAIKMIDEVFGELDGEPWPDLYDAKTGLQQALSSQEPLAVEHEVYIWEYMTNSTHYHHSERKPPEDAYDEGTLIPLYREPQPKAKMKRLSDEDLEKIVHENFNYSCVKGHYTASFIEIEAFVKSINDATEKLNIIPQSTEKVERTPINRIFVNGSNFHCVLSFVVETLVYNEDNPIELVAYSATNEFKVTGEKLNKEESEG